MRTTIENGKKYRAYSPDEFFKSPESPQRIFNLDGLKPKKPRAKDVEAETDPKAE